MTFPVGSETVLSSDSQLLTTEGEAVRYGAGDTFLVENVLPPDELEGAFERLCDEVQWCTMSHRGGEVPRLVAVEGTVDEDGTIPIYRHPADASPPLNKFSPIVELIRSRVSRLLPPSHPPLNHVLVQRYRSGDDYISEHSDKTIDIVKGSYIVNVSFGAQRTMTLRTKKTLHNVPHHDPSSDRIANNDTDSHISGSDRTKQRIPLPHNSVLFFGLETNRQWIHSIRRDRRIPTLLTEPECAFDRERISLTFRSIGTFLTPNPSADTNSTTEGEGKWLIWGQGARGKTRGEAHVVNSSKEEWEALIGAFGEENRETEFDWERAYGEGFDVLHFS